MLVVHLVPREAEDLANLFGEQTGDETDKFERCDWSPGPEGTPILSECGCGRATSREPGAPVGIGGRHPGSPAR